METDAAVEKPKNSFPTAACKTLRVSHSFRRLGDDESTNNKTGQITCYKNRTF
jgi:hypothetical protein